MMSEKDFNAAVALVARANGISEDLAAELVADVGDAALESDDQGRIIATARDGTRHPIEWPAEDEV